MNAIYTRELDGAVEPGHDNKGVLQRSQNGLEEGTA
jgi:hypothetical protein